MITLMPRPCQTLIAMIDGIAQNGSLIHFWGGSPMTPMTWLSSPLVGAVDPGPDERRPRSPR